MEPLRPATIKHWTQDFWDRDFKETLDLIESIEPELRETLRVQLRAAAIRAADPTKKHNELQGITHLRFWIRSLIKGNL